MRAVSFHELGEPDVLAESDAAIPTLAATDVLIEVEAAGVNFSDIAKRRGRYLEPTSLPYVPGSEVVGHVRKAGRAVLNLRVGDRVVGLIPSRNGGYAEFAVLPEAYALRAPTDYDAAALVALPNQGLTALHLLETVGRLQPGEVVLVHAAAGGVGGLAVQLARHLSAGMVIGLASQLQKREHLLALGADIVLDSGDPNWARDVAANPDIAAVDVVLDSVGGDGFDQSLHLLAPFGRIVCYGLASGTVPSVNPVSLMKQSWTVSGFHLDTIVSDPSRYRSGMQHLLRLVNDGALRPHVGLVLPLSQAAEAHRRIESREVIGKVVLVP